MVDVRRAGPGDADAVSGLERECLGADAWSHALVAQAVSGALPTIDCLVALDGDRVVGHALTSTVGDIVELQRLAVTPGLRRQGVASALLRAALAAAARTEADRMLLEVREDNRGALAFYADQGFVEIDRRPRYYTDGGTAVVLRRPLGRGCGGG